MPPALHPRDRAILAQVRAQVGVTPGFRHALRSLTATVERVIPGGRVFVLRTEPLVIGSHVSGVGLCSRGAGVEVVRVDLDGSIEHLAPLTSMRRVAL